MLATKESVMMTIETVVKILEESSGVWVPAGIGAATGEVGTAYCVGLGALETGGWKDTSMDSRESLAGCCE